MYAVVDIKAFQYKLEKGDTLRVPKFDTEVEKKVKLSKVLFIADGDKYSIGQPTLEGAVVEATVTDQGKHGKIIVFKKKRRKDYSVKRGHRQEFTELSIDNIKVSTPKKAAKKVTDKPGEIQETEVKTKAKDKAAEPAVKKTKAKASEKTAQETKGAPKKADSDDTTVKAPKESGTEVKETKAKKKEIKKPDVTKAALDKSENTDTSE